MTESERLENVTVIAH